MLSKVSIAATAAIFLVGCNQQHSKQTSTVQAANAASVASSAAPVAGDPNSPAADPAGSNSPTADPRPPITAEPIVAPAVNQWTVPAGTRIRVSLAETLDTKYCHPGESFAATLEEPIVLGQRVVVPKGASVHGHVTTSKQSGRFKGRAVLGLSLDSIQLNGTRYAIATNLTARVSSSHKKRNLAIIGGGSGGGAVIGAIAGGGVGAAIGAAAGAGAGTVGAFITGKKNVVLPVETELMFSLRSPVTVRG